LVVGGNDSSFLTSFIADLRGLDDFFGARGFEDLRGFRGFLKGIGAGAVIFGF